MTRTENFEQVEVDSAEALWTWLAANHGQGASIWLVTYKAHVPGKYLGRDAVLDALIAYGWIDGVRRKLDDSRTMQLIAPRAQQAWAASYKARAEALRQDGRMTPAGEAAIAASKAAGLWDFFDDVDRLIVPEDLQTALNRDPGGAVFFDGCAPSYRRNVLRWLKIAKTSATRGKRIDRICAASAAREKLAQM